MILRMTLLEDTRQQATKHEMKHKYFADNGIKVIRSKLPVGDYANMKNMSVIIDTKKDIQEIIGNVTKGHIRFVKECELARENDIQLIILIEDDDVKCIDDLYKWYNWRLKISPKATSGKTLAKILHGMEMRHGVKFEFCKKEDSGRRIIELLGGIQHECEGAGICKDLPKSC